jgi:DNA-directed RNA polymerase specialized sigma24 family protein
MKRTALRLRKPLRRTSFRRRSPMEDRLDAARAAREVRRILDAESEAVKAVLLEQEKSTDVASRLGVPVKRVYLETANAVRRLRAAVAGWELAT